MSTPNAPTIAFDDALSAYRRHALADADAARAELDGITHDIDASDWRDVNAAAALNATAQWFALSPP